MSRIVLVLAIILIVNTEYLFSNLTKWTPINKELSSAKLNSSLMIDELIYAVGENGVIKVTDLEGNISILNGDFSFETLMDIAYDDESKLLAVGNNSTLVISEDKGESWTYIETEFIDDFKSVVFFNEYFYVSSESNIYRYNPIDSEFNLFSNEFSGVNKLHAASDYLYAIGKNGLLLQKDETTFEKLSIGTNNNISEIISRENKIIIFPEMEYALMTEDDFKTTSRFNTKNNLFFIKNAAWIDDSLIVALGSINNLPPYNHAYSNNLLQTWNLGKDPYSPQVSLKGFGNKAIITAQQGVVMYLNKYFPFSEDFYRFGYMITFKPVNPSFSKLKLEKEYLYCININGKNAKININTYKSDEFLTDYKFIRELVEVDNEYFFLNSLEKFENGRNYYINHLIKVNDDNTEHNDTIYRDSDWVERGFRDLNLFNDKLFYNSKYNEISYFDIDNLNSLPKKVSLNGSLNEIFSLNDIYIDGNTTYLAIEVENTKGTLIKTNNLEDYEEIIQIENLERVSKYKDNIYLLTTSRNKMDRTHAVYLFKNDELIKIKEFYTQTEIFLFHTYRDLIVIHDRQLTLFSTDGGLTWEEENFNFEGGTHWDIIAHENTVYLSRGNFVYKREFDINTSVPSFDPKSEISIYPNPAREYIEVIQPSEGFKPSEGSEITITNMLGVEVATDVIHSMTQSHRMNVSHLPSGVYFFRIGTHVEKFVKW